MRDAEALGPGGVQGRHIPGRRHSLLDHAQAGRGERIGTGAQWQLSWRPVAEGWSVAFLQRDQEPDPAIRSEGACDGQGEGALALQNGAQQRAPGQGDAQLVDPAAQQVQGLACIAGQEERVGKSTAWGWPSGLPGRLAQSGGVRVDADRQQSGLGASGAQDGFAVARSQIQQDPLLANDQSVELADVDLAQLTSEDHAHAASSIAQVESRVRVPSSRAPQLVQKAWLASTG